MSEETKITRPELRVNRPIPSPSEEGSKTPDARSSFPSSEGLGVGSENLIAADNSGGEISMPAKSVERLFPFVVKSRAFIVGRDILARSKSNLHFILITTDISDNSRDQILRDYTHYPVVQCYTEADLEKFFAVKGTKVLGFTKSGLAQSIYAELKPHRINKPVESKRNSRQSEQSDS